MPALPFLNAAELLGGGDRRLRRAALAIMAAALRAADPKAAVLRALRPLLPRLRKASRIAVVGGGKAALPMAEAVSAVLGDRVSGVMNGLAEARVGGIVIRKSSHPLPSAAGVEGTEEMLRLAATVKRGEVLLCLFSGGGSAIMPLPPPGVRLEEKAALTLALLRCGATIHEMNAVRRHLSLFKGGRLAAAVDGGRVISLIISDVAGDRLESVSSGPTAPDPTTRRDAVAVLRRYGLWESAPAAIRLHLMSPANETLKPGAPIFRRVRNILAGNNHLSLKAAAAEARRRGFRPRILTSTLEGEAREVGALLAGLGLSASPPAVLLAGGETTVTVRGGGRGGRNQEVALSSLARLNGAKGVLVASLATDGADGTSGTAGALADREVWEAARRKGLTMAKYLDENNSAEFFGKTGAHLITGPTGTNVADVAVVVRG